MTSHGDGRAFAFLVNPSSGGGAAPDAVVPVARLLREAGAVVDVTYSPGPQAMTRLVDEAVARGDVVVSVGGDGMLSSLAGLVAGRDATLAMVPAGRGNDFARMLGLPDDPAALARVLLEGEVRRVDLLAVSGLGAQRRMVAGSIYAGVDARAAAIADRATWLPRSMQYPYAALRALAAYRPGRYRVAVDGIPHEYAAATVVVANSAYYGKGMQIAPPASIEDGVLDVIVIEAASRLALMRSLPKVYDGRHVALPEVTVLTGKRVELSGTLRGSAGGPIPVGGDGEPLGLLPASLADPAVVEVVPGALSVIC
ncbi:diacylglycerol/lipid kinase family protein [Nocardioides soli]|uniref:Diacylglycerol kinase family enzyme n=1 Tax=Nocardioides soli TaxID=1036020 RepID=A0A7W4W139_9ACTN|nr:diacylglycerol kinase family protein [Nocardioides soli]MBB3045444.1 diacylglycerol kinase family enzyme [Nocardioides soli]